MLIENTNNENLPFHIGNPNNFLDFFFYLKQWENIKKNGGLRLVSKEQHKSAFESHLSMKHSQTTEFMLRKNSLLHYK